MLKRGIYASMGQCQQAFMHTGTLQMCNWFSTRGGDGLFLERSWESLCPSGHGEVCIVKRIIDDDIVRLMPHWV